MAAVVETIKTDAGEHRVLYANIDLRLADGGIVHRLERDWDAQRRRRFRCGAMIPHPATLHHVSVFEEHGRFDEGFRIAGDYEFLLRELPDHPPLHVPMVMVDMQRGGLSDRPANRGRIAREVYRARYMHGIVRLPSWASRHLYAQLWRIWRDVHLRPRLDRLRATVARTPGGARRGDRHLTSPIARSMRAFGHGDAQGGPRDRRPRGHGLESRQGLLPRAGLHEARPRRATTSPSPTARCPGCAGGRWRSSASSTASTRSRSSRSARPTTRPDWMRHGRRCRSRRDARPTRSWCDDAAQLVWVVNLGCIDLNPHPVRADDMDHPDELRVDLDPVPGVPWSQIREVALVAQRGPRRTSAWSAGRRRRGSRGIHVYVRIEPRWTFGEVRRAALALAREVERRAPDARDAQVVEGGAPRRVPRLQPEREGPHRRVARTRCGRTPDARVSMPLRWDEVADVVAEDFTLATVPALFASAATPAPASTTRSARSRGCSS